MSDQQQDIKINSLEENHKFMAEKIDDLKETVIGGFNDIKKEFTCLKKESDEKYASKLTEQIVYGMVGLALVGVLGGILALVIK